MSISLLGKKIGMTQIFDNNDDAIPVTILQLGPCVVTQIKDVHSDGYKAIQLGYYEVSEKKITKSIIGHLLKSESPPLKYIYEHKTNSLEDFQLSQIITVENLKIGHLIDVSGNSIGKGFTGYHKRHKFSRGPMTHGSKNHKQPGSIGAGTTPGRVFPGKKMAGHMGNRKVTIKNLKIIDIYAEENVILVKGAVPGKSGSIIKIYQK